MSTLFRHAQFVHPKSQIECVEGLRRREGLIVVCEAQFGGGGDGKEGENGAFSDPRKGPTAGAVANAEAGTPKLNVGW